MANKRNQFINAYIRPFKMTKNREKNVKKNKMLSICKCINALHNNLLAHV